MTSSNQFHTLGKNARFDRLSVAKLSLDSEWKTYTPAFTTAGQAWGTTVVNLWRYRIVGRTLSVKGTVVQTVAGTSAAGNYALTLPAGCTCFVINYACGGAYIAGATKRVLGQVQASSTNFIINYVDPTSGTTVFIPWNDASDADFKLTANGLTVSVTFDVELSPSSPILQ
jgi:hypothetical protein